MSQEDRQVLVHICPIYLFINESNVVVPSWVSEPQDASVVAGAPLVLRCAAAGRPAPAVAWHRRQADGEGEG